MNVRATYETKEEVMQQTEILPDPFWKLVHDPSIPKATVQVEVNRSHDTGGGWVKCGFVVTLSCPQSVQFIEAAAELAFKTAVGYVNDGMSHLAPGLEPMAPNLQDGK